MLGTLFLGAFTRKAPATAAHPERCDAAALSTDTASIAYRFVDGLKSRIVEGDTARARQRLENLAAVDSTYAPLFHELAGLTMYTDPETALKYAARACRLDSTNKWYCTTLAQAQIVNERYGAALDTYLRLREIDPQNPDIYRMLSLLYEQEGQPYSAISVLDSAEVHFGKIDYLNDLKRRLLVKTRQYDRAEKEALEQIAIAPYKIENYLIAGELYNRQQRDSLALVYFREAFRIDSTDLRTLASLSEFYNERKEYRTALGYVRRMFDTRQMPLNEKIGYFERLTSDRNFYGTYYPQLNELATTLALRHPTEPEVVRLYAGHLIASGDPEQALAYYKSHLDDRPPQIDYYNGIVDIESYLNRPDSVDLYIDRALELFPESTDLRLRKGMALTYLKQYTQAIDYYRNLLPDIASDSVRGIVWGIIGDLHHQIVETDTVHTGRSRTNFVRRNMKQCYKAYETALELYPDNVSVLNNYAYFLTLENREPERAFSMARRVMELEGDNPTFIDTYGWILFRAGRLEEAKQAIRQAISLDRTNSPELQLHYGDILEALGEKFMAEVYWKKALENGYKDPEAIVERIKRLQEEPSSRP